MPGLYLWGLFTFRGTGSPAGPKVSSYSKIQLPLLSSLCSAQKCETPHESNGKTSLTLYASSAIPQCILPRLVCFCVGCGFCFGWCGFSFERGAPTAALCLACHFSGPACSTTIRLGGHELGACDCCGPVSSPPSGMRRDRRASSVFGSCRGRIESNCSGVTEIAFSTSERAK